MPAAMKLVNIAQQCKALCLKRCMHAIAMSVMIQFLLLELFLLCINFSILHPIQWISAAIGLIFGLSTWLGLLPLIIVVSLYGIILGKSYLTVQKYYSTRFHWLIGRAWLQCHLFVLSVCIGFLTAWLYAAYLHVDYRDLKVECYGNECINSRYIFLMYAGAATGCYYFLKELLRVETKIEFPIIQEAVWVNVRDLFYAIVYNSLIKSLLSTMYIALAYLFIGGMITKSFANVFLVEIDDSRSGVFNTLIDSRLLVYTWMISAQILSNMHLMQQLLFIFMGQQMHFPIEKSAMLADDHNEILLVDALAMSQLPVVQNLAALNLYEISMSKLAARRQPIFALSVPGGHPYNWNQVSGQCLSLIEAFTDELSIAVKKISTMKTVPLYIESCQSATEAAEKILLRQYNAMNGIRRMIVETAPVEELAPRQKETCGQYVNQRIQMVSQQVDSVLQQIETSVYNAFRAIPGVVYMLEEPDGAKTAFLLSNSNTICLMVQSLANICAASLVEDMFGVVQASLPQIIKALLKLKLELDKLNNVNLNGKKLDRNLVALRNAIKRSLYKICIVFGDYLRDIVNDPEDLRNLQSFLNFQEA